MPSIADIWLKFKTIIYEIPIMKKYHTLLIQLFYSHKFFQKPQFYGNIAFANIQTFIQKYRAEGLPLFEPFSKKIL